ncbi:hypothetical protein EJ08DRAFT_726188 [Tothia fuscella]|uniref:Uncharacterized protein n=1 Tax=Tothia fuscella TaxID=1048955 RepID=A0A9P4TTB6_9PEZI|nr:hypothetical protein EJ08DRAFT_726188 [Tothia fuscella]
MVSTRAKTTAYNARRAEKFERAISYIPPRQPDSEPVYISYLRSTRNHALADDCVWEKWDSTPPTIRGTHDATLADAVTNGEINEEEIVARRSPEEKAAAGTKLREARKIAIAQDVVARTYADAFILRAVVDGIMEWPIGEHAIIPQASSSASAATAPLSQIPSNSNSTTIAGSLNNHTVSEPRFAARLVPWTALTKEQRVQYEASEANKAKLDALQAIALNKPDRSLRQSALLYRAARRHRHELPLHDTPELHASRKRILQRMAQKKKMRLPSPWNDHES